MAIYQEKAFIVKVFLKASINRGLDHCVVDLTVLLSLINNQL